MSRPARYPLDITLLADVVASMPARFSTVTVANDARMVERYGPPSCLWVYGYYSRVGTWLSAHRTDFGIDILVRRIHDGGGALWHRTEAPLQLDNGVA